MAIVFYLTDAGKKAVLDQANLGLKLNLTNIVLGTSKYDASSNAASMTALKNQVFSSKLSGGLAESSTQSMRIVAYIESTITTSIYEIGFTDTNGVLFAVAASTTDPLMQLVNNVTSIGTFSLQLTNVDMANVSVYLDSNSPIAVALMANHLANADPHPQYLTRADFSTHINTTMPKLIGSGVIAGGQNTIDMSAVTAIDDLRSAKYSILVTPEGQHEGWDITRNSKSFTVNVWNRSGTDRVPYSGNLNWAVQQSYLDDIPSGNGLYASAGTYTIAVLPNETKQFQISGGGGGGGISSRSSNSQIILVNGSDGTDTSIVLGSTRILTAGAGKGAVGGLWGNGSSFQNGSPGAGGTVTTYSNFTPTQVTSGNSGSASQANQSGGVSVSAESNYGAGGNGTPGVGDNGLAFGAGGGSGAFGSINYKNTTSATQFITITVGKGGDAVSASSAGTTGYARVTTLST